MSLDVPGAAGYLWLVRTVDRVQVCGIRTFFRASLFAAGERPVEPPPPADTTRPEALNFSALAEAVDPHGLPGVQSRASASMLTMPLALANRR